RREDARRERGARHRRAAAVRRRAWIAAPRRQPRRDLAARGAVSVPITDSELRGELLTVFHGLRHNADGWVPTSDMNVTGTDASRGMVGAVCQQLADAGLITWKPLKGASE